MLVSNFLHTLIINLNTIKLKSVSVVNSRTSFTYVKMQVTYGMILYGSFHWILHFCIKRDAITM